MKNILEKVRARSEIPVYEKSIENVLSSILTSEDFWKIVDLSEEPLPLVSDIIRVLEEEGIVSIDEGIKLTEKGNSSTRSSIVIFLSICIISILLFRKIKSFFGLIKNKQQKNKRTY